METNFGRHTFPYTPKILDGECYDVGDVISAAADCAALGRLAARIPPRYDNFSRRSRVGRGAGGQVPPKIFGGRLVQACELVGLV